MFKPSNTVFLHVSNLSLVMLAETVNCLSYIYICIYITKPYTEEDNEVETFVMLRVRIDFYINAIAVILYIYIV